jgi:hypothetical protein
VRAEFGCGARLPSVKAGRRNGIMSTTVTNIEDLRRLAKRRVPRMFYDYADSGSWTESTYRANEADFARIKLRQRVAVDMTMLKEVVADFTLENRLLKKACSRMGKTAHEISGFREDRDHPSGRAVPSVGS